MITAVLLGWVLATGLLAFFRVSRMSRIALTGILPIALGLGAFVMVDIWPGPKPYRFEPFGGEAELLAREFREGQAIYMWLRLETGDPTPRAYSFPWSEELAQQIEEAEGKAEREGGEVRVQFEGTEAREGHGEPPTDGLLSPLDLMLSLEDREPPIVYAAPHERPPPKPPAAAENPRVHLNRGWSSP